MLFFAVNSSSLRRTAIAMATGAGLMLAASQAAAVIVWSGPVNLAIPNTFNGLYLNVITGAINEPGNTDGDSVPGWDVNPFATGTLAFFTFTGAPNSATTTGTVGRLPFGTPITGASTFTTGTVTPPAGVWALNSNQNFVGFRFLNESAATVHYGWMQIGMGANTINGRTLVSYAYESSPLTAIPAGVVPEPGTYALMGLGIAGVLLAARRRKQKA